ncbi:sulfatase [Verrucomicrobiota bacterium]|nr:sulfatase [Verrucomicrobiota bacterium]
MKTPLPSLPPRLPRRAFLADLGMGFTGLALGAMLQRDARASSAAAWSPPTGLPHSRAKAKSVIWLFMNGGVSHMESFDPKPMLTKYGGKTIAETPFKDAQDPKKLAIERLVVPDGNGNQRNTLYPLQIGFQKHGQCGLEVSDWFPHIARNADKLAVVRSMWTTDSNHGAQTQFHSGRHMNDGDYPNLGAWVHYGLGSLNDNLPQFISIGNREYWNKRDAHYLGPAHDAVPLRIDPSNPLDFSRPERPFTADAQSLGMDLVHQLNALRGVEYPQDPALAARVASYELAFRMQRSVPEVLDFAKESEETKKLYGIDQPATRDFGMQLLAARRFVERGVRFIQIQHGAGGAGAWDAHGGLKNNHTKNALAVDQPTGALLIDLERRGLLDETLVVFATEFGRTPGSQGSDGRDHHIFGFTVWMAGGGLKRGVVHGTTDEIGFHAAENRHYVTDIHATILQQLGLDSRRLEIPGRKRLEIDHGKPISEIIA